MNGWETILGPALNDVGAHLGGTGNLTTEDAAGVRGLLRHVSFPAILGLLGTSGKEGEDLGQVLLHAAATSAAGREGLQKEHVSPDDVERALTAVFIHGASPQQLPGAPGLRDEILQTGIEELAKRTGAVITPEEAATAVRLLATGQFFGDIASATAAIVFVGRALRSTDRRHDICAVILVHRRSRLILPILHFFP